MLETLMQQCRCINIYSDKYLKTFASLWQYRSYKPALTDAGAMDNFAGNSNSFKFKQKKTGKTENSGKNVFDIMVSLKY